jgi:hypothetical protein
MPCQIAKARSLPVPRKEVGDLNRQESFSLFERLEDFMIRSRDAACWACNELWRFRGVAFARSLVRRFAAG